MWILILALSTGFSTGGVALTQVDGFKSYEECMGAKKEAEKYLRFENLNVRKKHFQKTKGICVYRSGRKGE